MLTSKHTWLSVIRIFMGYILLESGIQKLLGLNAFASGLAGTLGKFAASNPHLWYKGLILGLLIPNAELMAHLVWTGEIVAGAFLILGFLTPVGAFIALLLNLNFLFAAGWTSPSTHTVNFLMVLIDLVLMFSGAGDRYGLDAYVIRKFPKTSHWLASA